MNNIEIGKRLEKARITSRKSLEEVALNIGVAKSTIQRYEKGKITNLKLPVIESISRALGVNPSWVVGKSDSMFLSDNPSIISVKVLGRVSAGIPIEAIEDVVDIEEVSSAMSKGCNLFGLRIHGDSMSPRIMDGDTVIVRQQDDAESDEIVIALINGHDGVCKKLKKLDTGLMLISLNPSYEPMVFTKSEIDQIPVRIIGKVVELRGKF